MRVYLKELLDPRLTRLMTLSLIRRLFFLISLMVTVIAAVCEEGNPSLARNGKPIAALGAVLPCIGKRSGRRIEHDAARGWRRHDLEGQAIKEFPGLLVRKPVLEEGFDRSCTGGCDDDAAPDRVANESRRVVDVQLGHHASAIRLDGVVG